MSEVITIARALVGFESLYSIVTKVDLIQKATRCFRLAIMEEVNIDLEISLKPKLKKLKFDLRLLISAIDQYYSCLSICLATLTRG